MEKGTVMMIYLHFSYISWKDRITLQCKQWHFDSSVRLFKASYKELNAPQKFWAMKKVSKHKLFSIWMSRYLLRLKKTMNDSDYERRKRMTLLIVGKCWRPGQQNQQYKKQRRDFPGAHLQQALQHSFQKHLYLRKQAVPHLFLQGLKISDLVAHLNLGKMN